jgi:hypothetical protein
MALTKHRKADPSVGARSSPAVERLDRLAPYTMNEQPCSHGPEAVTVIDITAFSFGGVVAGSGPDRSVLRGELAGVQRGPEAPSVLHGASMGPQPIKEATLKHLVKHLLMPAVP